MQLLMMNRSLTWFSGALFAVLLGCGGNDKAGFPALRAPR